MAQFFEQAREEMKRADHLLYVSLKYTRTVDVIKSLIERLSNAIDAMIDALLEHALEKNMIFENPENLGLKGDLAKKTYKSELVNEMVDFNRYLKQINRAEYRRSKEFRRHVTMTVITDAGTSNIDIDIMKEYYVKTKEYIERAETLVYGEKDAT